jgi:hypothetical protein
MNPRTLRAMLPVLKEAREAGVLELEAGEGKNRIRLRLAPPAPSGEPAMVPGMDEGAPADEAESDPRFYLEKFHAELWARGGDG